MTVVKVVTEVIVVTVVIVVKLVTEVEVVPLVTVVTSEQNKKWPNIFRDKKNFKT